MSTLSLRKIKHDSSAVDNIVTNSDGGVGIGGIDPSTLPAFIDHAVKVQNGGGLGIQSANATDNRWIFFGHGTANLDVQRAGIVNQGSDQSLALATAGSQRLIVDASGRITTPSQPCFVAVPSSSYGISGNTATKINFNSTIYNNGGHYSTANQRFTAPVTGYYFTIVHAYIYGGSYDANVFAYKNGSAYARGQSYNGVSAAYGSNPGGATLSTIMYLTAGDYVEGWYSLNDDGRATNIYNGQNTTRFEMYLLG